MQNLSSTINYFISPKNQQLREKLYEILKKIEVIDLFEILMYHLKINPVQSFPFLNYILNENTIQIFENIQIHLFQPYSITKKGSEIISNQNFWIVIQCYYLILNNINSQHSEYLYQKLKQYRKYKLIAQQLQETDKAIDEIMYQHDKYKLDTSKPKTYEQQISYFIELMIDQLQLINYDIHSYKKYLLQKVEKENEFTKIQQQKSTMINNMCQKIMDRIQSPENYDTPQFPSKDQDVQVENIPNLDPQKLILKNKINQIVDSSDNQMILKNEFTFKKTIENQSILSPVNRVTTTDKLLNKENQLPYVKSSYKKNPQSIGSNPEIVRLISLEQRNQVKQIFVIQDCNLKQISREKVGVNNLKMIDSDNVIQIGKISFAPIEACEYIGSYCIFENKAPRSDDDDIEQQIHQGIQLIENLSGNAYQNIIYVPNECIQKE